MKTYPTEDEQQALYGDLYDADKFVIREDRRFVLRVMHDHIDRTFKLNTDYPSDDLTVDFRIFFDARMRLNHPILTFSLRVKIRRQGLRRISHIDYDPIENLWRESRYGKRDWARPGYIFSGHRNAPAIFDKVVASWHIHNSNMIDTAPLFNYAMQGRFPL